MRIKTIHRYVGIVTVIVFLLTGQYMRFNFPDLYQGNEIIWYMFRANHVYILFAGLLNITLGTYLVVQLRGWKRYMQFVGSALLLVAPVLLMAGFFYEAPLATPERYITALGVLLLTIGVICHLPNTRFERDAP